MKLFIVSGLLFTIIEAQLTLGVEEDYPLSSNMGLLALEISMFILVFAEASYGVSIYSFSSPEPEKPKENLIYS